MWRSSDFISRKQDIIKHFKKKGVTSDTIVEYCSLAGIPIVVACEFLAEAFPESAELCNSKIIELNIFFGVK